MYVGRDSGIVLLASNYHAMSVEAAVGPHRELSPGPGVSHAGSGRRRGRCWRGPRDMRRKVPKVEGALTRQSRTPSALLEHPVEAQFSYVEQSARPILSKS